jgi:hypothetical protein
MTGIMRLMGIGILFFCLACVSCGTSGAHVQHGINAYQRGDYKGAAQQLGSLEDETSNMNPKGYCRYLVYRGLTLYKLGDRAGAVPFLTKGKEAMDRGDSRWIPPNIAAQVQDALDDISRSSSSYLQPQPFRPQN